MKNNTASLETLLTLIESRIAGEKSTAIQYLNLAIVTLNCVGAAQLANTAATHLNRAAGLCESRDNLLKSIRLSKENP